MAEIAVLDAGGVRIAEVRGEAGSVRGAGDAAALISGVAGKGIRRALAARELIDASFFDLQTGFADQLAKQVQESGVRLAVYGRFSLVESLALKAFILKSGLGGAVRLFPGRDAALRWLTEA